jgi:membrane protein YdbS with pleckstrin-like domain
MSQVEKNLMAGEQVVYKAKIHWCVYSKAIIAFVIGLVVIALGLSFADKMREYTIIFGVVILVLSAIIFFGDYARAKSYEYVVTNKRLILKKGILKLDVIELMLTKVDAVKVSQTVAGRMFDYGTITVSTRDTSNDFPLIKEPHAFRNAIGEQVDNLNRTMNQVTNS